MLIVASISARGGSKGVPGKNLRKVGKLSLVERAISTCKQVPSISHILVSSDDADVLQIASNHKCHPYERPKNLADDHTSLHMVTKHNTEVIEATIGRPDCIVQFSPTCPFLKTSTVEHGIQRVVSGKNTSAVSMFKVEHSHPYRARILKPDNTFVNFITDVDVESARYHSRQDLPELWCTSGGLYIRDYDTMMNLDGNSFGFGLNPYALKVDSIEAVNIDNMIDLEFAQFLAHKYDEI